MCFITGMSFSSETPVLFEAKWLALAQSREERGGEGRRGGGEEREGEGRRAERREKEKGKVEVYRHRPDPC